MELTARESIRFFGMWDQPRTMLAWDDVKSRCCSWKTLRNDFHCSRENLQRMQPDKGEWIKRGALTLHDLVDMSIFPINPGVQVRDGVDRAMAAWLCVCCV